MKLIDEELLTAPRKAKPYKIFDGQGLYAEIPPTGNIRWRWKYRFGGKEKKIALGLYPVISIDLARVRREEMKTLLKSGVDPGVRRKEVKLFRNATEQTLNFELSALLKLRREKNAKLKEAHTYVSTLREVIYTLRSDLQFTEGMDNGNPTL